VRVVQPYGAGFIIIYGNTIVSRDVHGDSHVQSNKSFKTGIRQRHVRGLYTKRCDEDKPGWNSL